MLTDISHLKLNNATSGSKYLAKLTAALKPEASDIPNDTSETLDRIRYKRNVEYIRIFRFCKTHIWTPSLFDRHYGRRVEE